MARKVITVTRQMGSNGDLIASELARTLGIPLLERQIVEAAAAAAGVSPDTISQVEKVPGFLERMLEYLGQHAGGFDPLSDFAMESAPATAMSTESYRGLIENLMRKTAQESDAVIVGHGGAIVLGNLPYVFKLFVCAPRMIRNQRLQEYEHISLEEATARIQEDDKTRLEYFQTYYRVNWLNPALYDVSINTARLDVPVAVSMIETAYAKAQLE